MLFAPTVHVLDIHVQVKFHPTSFVAAIGFMYMYTQSERDDVSLFDKLVVVSLFRRLSNK